jgi:hypothetical protein
MNTKEPMSPASDALHRVDFERRTGSVAAREDASPVLENLAGAAEREESAGYVGEVLDSRSTVGFQAWTLAMACRHAQSGC